MQQDVACFGKQTITLSSTGISSSTKGFRHQAMSTSGATLTNCCTQRATRHLPLPLPRSVSDLVDFVLPAANYYIFTNNSTQGDVTASNKSMSTLVWQVVSGKWQVVNCVGPMERC